MNARPYLPLVLSALFVALVCGTTLFCIGLPGAGYVHLGDAMILLAALMLPWSWAGAAAGVGSAMADLFLGYSIYAPGTLLIKAGMAIVASLLLRRAVTLPRLLLAALLGGLLLVGGYFAYDLIFFREFALADLPGNALQALAGQTIGTVACWFVNRLRLKEKFFK